MKVMRGGIDIGSTTVKLVLLDEQDKIIFGKYERHNADTQATLCKLLKEAKNRTGREKLRLKITGSGSINLGKALNIDFIQEVVAVATALKAVRPQTDVAIELGGEDAKIIYFEAGSIDERMNGVCAGGTGAFIDQMASLLQTDATGLNTAAENYKHIYPIAARCGVFAKTDIQPLINEGATREDLAASIFQAVVNQTISGLAQGKPIKGCVAFLGGPLHFMPQLKKAFIRTLKLTPETTVDPENSHLFAAMGGALEATGMLELDELIEKLEKGVEIDFEMPRLPALFESEKDFRAFTDRHNRAVVPKAELGTYSGNCYLGIDAGSTTTKLALIGEEGQLLYSFYSNNNGNPVETAKKALTELYSNMSPSAKIAYSCSTGYGEELLKTAFCLDEGEVETIAHTTAAKFFQPQVDCVLDIGGQDMKCIKLKNGAVDSIMLNEACSSGCGSFIENFANSLGYTAAEFSRIALNSRNPVDLGTRCTVFMNSNVKQAQKEGAQVSDISAGLAYSVIKNAIYKVIKLASAKDLGEYIVVQGGTFHNKAVLRAFENIVGVQVICPDISGIMGAFGAALLAKERHRNQATTTMSRQEIENLTYKSTGRRCGGCSNNCMLTINTFGGGRHHITGNRCEKGSGNHWVAKTAPNLVEYKRHRFFDYQPLDDEKAVRGTIGIPRALNMYENFPFWAVFFKELGFKVVLSPYSSREIYELGMDSIPSESECYPAKLTHGHVEWLIKNGVKTIFHPCVFYEKKETPDAVNSYNCPIVISYPENIKNNVESIAGNNIEYIRPFISFANEKTIADRMADVCKEYWNIPANEVKNAVKIAMAESEKAKADLKAEAAKIIDLAGKEDTDIIVLAGRPYHIDPEINHGIPELIASYGIAVLTEDSLPVDFTPARPLRVVDQWSYHSRLYTAAEFVAKHKNMQLIQLTSFGCGLDAVTSDQVSEILEQAGKLYTLLKIDEVNNLGAARIRIRSLISAMNMRRDEPVQDADVAYNRTGYTKRMQNAGYTLIAPQMSPIHFNILEKAMRKHGYNVVVLDNDNRAAIDTGLKFVNNDACYPSITAVGQIMEAVLSGRYDTDKLAIMMTQTGGCCRASNYVAFIRRALEKAGLSHIPVISVSATGMEKNEGFRLSPGLLADGFKSVVLGDLLMRCLYRTRPYEKVAGSANRLHKQWEKNCIDYINGKSSCSYKALCRDIVNAFDNLELDETIRKPRVGVVGEILVKYMPLANNHIVDLLEGEGAEVVVPDMLDFFNYSIYGAQYRSEFLGIGKSSGMVSKATIGILEKIRKPAVDALKASKRFDRPVSIYEIGEMTKPFLSLGNQYGEGWFLAGEMIELVTHGTPNVVCIQPFACLPNHVVGKGVIKAIKKEYPQANIAAVDYDPGASEVNQLNRIKLMLSSALHMK